MVYWILSFCIGAVTVLQGGLNRKITTDWGLAGAVFLNSFLLIFLALVFVWITYTYPHLFPESFAPKFQRTSFRWWFVIPSFCGLLIICMIPALIPKVGASSVFLCMIIGQLTFSLLWDLKVENIEIESKRYLGLVFAFIGLVISYWKK